LRPEIQRGGEINTDNQQKKNAGFRPRTVQPRWTHQGEEKNAKTSQWEKESVKEKTKWGTEPSRGSGEKGCFLTGKGPSAMTLIKNCLREGKKKPGCTKGEELKKKKKTKKNIRKRKPRIEPKISLRKEKLEGVCWKVKDHLYIAPP